MTICLGVLFVVLRLGLRSRKARLVGAPLDVNLIKLHMRLAKPAVAFVMLGFVGGGLSSSLIRNWSLMESFHAIVALVVVALFCVTAFLGRRAERGEGEPGTHGLFGLLAMLGSALAAVAGFILLP
jgi:hypothetical protein